MLAGHGFSYLLHDAARQSQRASGCGRSIRSIRRWSPSLDAWLVRFNSSIVHKLTLCSWLVVVLSVILLVPDPAEYSAGCRARVYTGWKALLWRYQRRPGAMYRMLRALRIRGGGDAAGAQERDSAKNAASIARVQRVAPAPTEWMF
jgi:hypothetical protein